MLNGFIDTFDRFHGYDGLEVFRTPVSLRGRLDTRIDGEVPPYRHELHIQRQASAVTAASRWPAGAPLIHQKGFRRSTDAGSPHFGIDDN